MFVILFFAAVVFTSQRSGFAGSEQRSPLRFDCASTFPPTLSARELADRYGERNVRTDSIYLGEGMYAVGSTVFPDAPSRRVEIVWKDTVNMRSPEVVRIRAPASEWRAPPGIAIGTSLKRLEALNRRPFRIAGFAFDGSGVVTSWSGGRLDTRRDAPCRLRARVDGPTTDGPAGSGRSARTYYLQVIGDRIFSSGHPALQYLNPGVSELWLVYR